MLHEEVPFPFVCRLAIREVWRTSNEFLTNFIFSVPVDWSLPVELWHQRPLGPFVSAEPRYNLVFKPFLSERRRLLDELFQIARNEVWEHVIPFPRNCLPLRPALTNNLAFQIASNLRELI
jgi:hypothetical protein